MCIINLIVILYSDIKLTACDDMAIGLHKIWQHVVYQELVSYISIFQVVIGKIAKIA